MERVLWLRITLAEDFEEDDCFELGVDACFPEGIGGGGGLWFVIVEVLSGTE